MKLAFDLQNITTTEFGVGLDDGDGQSFFVIPVDKDVQTALHEMTDETWMEMLGMDVSPTKYDPSEKYGATEYLYVPVDDDLAVAMVQLHSAHNLATDVSALNDPADIFCYFA